MSKAFEETVSDSLDSISNTIGASILTFLNVFQSVDGDLMKESQKLVDLAMENTMRKDG